MMDKFAIFDYAEKGALADYEKACMMYKLFQDEKSKAAMDDALGTAREIRRLHEAEIDKMRAAKAPQAEEPPQAQQSEAQQAQAVPLNWSVNVEFVSGRRSCFRHDDEELARAMYGFSKKKAMDEFKSQIRRVSLTQRNSDGSETVLASMDIG